MRCGDGASDRDGHPWPTSASALVVTVVLVVAVAGWLVGGCGKAVSPPSRSSPPSLASPSPSPSTIMPSPTAAGAAAAGVPHTQAWTVVRLQRPAVAYVRPDRRSRERLRLATTTGHGRSTVLLVNQTMTVRGELWYRVWLPVPPNGSRGWVRAGRVATYTVHNEIVIHRSRRVLEVVHNDRVVARFRVAVGAPSLPTPAGLFYVTEKLRPADSGGPYGVLALALSAFQPTLSYWQGGGQVAIHGTNDPGSIGHPASHGCVRMTNQDILALSGQVRAGSPVVITD